MKVIFGIAFIGLIAASIAEPECSDENELVANPDDCSSYYSCENGFPIIMTCRPGLLFDVNTHTCVDCNEAVCAGSEPPVPPVPEHPEETTTTSEKPTPPVECPEQQSPDDNVLLPNPLDCGSYYQCVWGKPILQKCPRGLHFNNKLKRCDYPGPANCTVTP